MGFAMATGFFRKQRSSHSEVLKVFRLGRLLISLVATVLALFLKDLRWDVVVDSTEPEFLQKLTLIIYYFCWLFGSRADTNVQESVYISVPSTWRVTLPEFFLVIAFAGLAGALLWAAGDEKRFAILLSLFTAANIAGWWFLNRKLKPLMSGSRKQLVRGSAYLDLERLNVVTNYLTGTWQWRRFVVMGILVIVFDIVCFVPPVRAASSDWIAYLVADLNSKSDAISRLLPDALFLLFVLVAETWIWIKRVRVATSLDILDEMKLKYRLSKA
jgi:hypothetical protein